MTIWE
jgi:hypothetical protein